MDINKAEDFKYSEWSLDHLVIENVKKKQKRRFLLPASERVPVDGSGGHCAPLSTTDAMNQRRILHELTCCPVVSAYYNQVFSESYSSEDLIDRHYDHMYPILNHVKTYGVTSAYRYSLSPKLFGTTYRDLTGCPLLRIDDFDGIDPIPTPLTENVLDQISTELRSHGPIVAGFTCYRDFYRLAEDFLYIPDESLGFHPACGITSKPDKHAVMGVGYGHATHLKTSAEYVYLVIQNNWGRNGRRIGRMPLDKFSCCYWPEIRGQVNFEDYMLHQGDRELQLRWMTEQELRSTLND